MFHSMRRFALCFIWLCLVVTPVFAQKVTSTIRGTVTDQTGAAIADADVTAKNQQTNATRSVKTNGSGEYVFPELEAGKYEVRVKQANFKEFVTPDVDLFVSSTAVVNASLQVGSTTDQVTVEANTVQVETSTGAVGNVVEGKEVRELPLNGRSFVQLTQLMPGVSPQANFDSKNKGLMTGVDFSVNGNNTTGNLFLVDGVNNNDIGSNRTILVYPSIDAIQEFKILRNSYGPEYGQAMGAIVNIITRSGTNQWHGGVFYSGRNDALNATDYFNTLRGADKDVLRRNDWGYNFGGPIKKDKLFFFWEQEWNRELRGKLRSANVPTVAEKGAGFDPATGAFTTNPDFTNLRTASDGSACENTPTIGASPVTAIPGNQFSRAGALMVQLFPDPNIPSSSVSPDDCINWAQSFTAPIHWRQENVRVDYKLTSTWSIMGRYTRDDWSQPFPSTLDFWGDDIYPSVETSWIQPGTQATIKISKLLGNTAVNDFQVSYAANRITADRSGANPGLNNQISAVFPTEFPLSDKPSGVNIGYPIFWGGFGSGADSDTLWTQAPWHNNEQLLILKDDFSKVVGSHTFKLGFLATNNQKNELVNGSSGEAPEFWGVAGPDTDNPGRVDSSNGTFNALWGQVLWNGDEFQTNPFGHTRWHDYEIYFGDSWKVRRNLTLEYGVRWSLLRQPFDATNRIASFDAAAYDPALGSDPCNGVFLVPGTNACQDLGFLGGRPGPNRSLKENNNHMIAPRLGIAWDPRGDGKMSIRAGVGQFFQRERLTNYLNVANNSPFSLNAPSITRPMDTDDPGFDPANGTGSPKFGIDPDNLSPNTWQWNLTVERELFRDSKIEVAYVGNKALHALRYNDANAVPISERLNFSLTNNDGLRPFGVGDFGRIVKAQWKASANYHALQTLFRTRMKALDAQFAYTFSKSLADTDVTNSGTNNADSVLLDPFNPRLNYGSTYINRPHTFVGNLIYTLPPFAGHSALTRYAVGGWELSSILSYSSGPSITIFANGDVAGAPGGLTGTGTNVEAFRPNRVAGQSCRAPSGSPAIQWLNPNAWTLDNFQLGTFGTSGVGECSGPGIANTDFSVHKNFKLTERVNAQFRMDFFNVFNKTQFRGNGGGFTGVETNFLDSTSVDLGTNRVVFDPSTDIKQDFGQIQSDRGPREIQYQLKIEF